MKEQDIIINRFRKISRFYDLLSFASYLRKAIVKMSGVNSRMRVLDVCTATGNLAFEFARYAKDVVGIDISRKMLEIARRKNRDGKVKFVQMDAAHLSFPDKSFEIASNLVSIHEMAPEMRKKVLKEMGRVAREKIIILDYHLPANFLFKDLASKLLAPYESRYFPDFIKTDLGRTIVSAGLKIEKEKRVFGLFKLYLCQPPVSS